MSKRALLAVVGFLGLCISLTAQGIAEPGSMPSVTFGLNPVSQNATLNTRSTNRDTDLFGTLTNAWNDPVPLQLADGRIFSFPSAFAWVEAPPNYFLPAMALAAPPRVV